MQIKFFKLPAIVRLSQIGISVFAIARIIKEEMQSVADRRIEKITQKHDLIKRGEFESLKSITSKMLIEVEQLKKQIHSDTITTKTNKKDEES